MAKKKKAVRIRAMVERINRKLAANGQILMATRRMKTIQHFGDYYILELSGNVVDAHIDPEKLARKLGVLKEEEQVEPKKGKKWSPSRKELGQKAKRAAAALPLFTGRVLSGVFCGCPAK